MNNSKYDVKILESENDFISAVPVLIFLRPYLTQKKFLELREQYKKHNKIFFGIFEKENCVCVAEVSKHFHTCGADELWVNSIVTLPDMRSKGYGQCMMQHIESYGKEAGCFRIILHSAPDNLKGHSFYQKIGMKNKAVVFVKEYFEPIPGYMSSLNKTKSK